jgi:hypothetical protein
LTLFARAAYRPFLVFPKTHFISQNFIASGPWGHMAEENEVVDSGGESAFPSPDPAARTTALAPKSELAKAYP